MNRREALQALIALPAVKSIAVATLQPADVIVIESDDSLSYDQIRGITEAMARVWPGQKVVVFERGLRMRIARA